MVLEYGCELLVIRKYSNGYTEPGETFFFSNGRPPIGTKVKLSDGKEWTVTGFDLAKEAVICELKKEEKIMPDLSCHLKEFSLTDELWREYDWNGRVYRIERPQKLFLRVGGTTHRVVDENGVVHCVPSVGVMGCVLRWETRDKVHPVIF